MKYKINIERKKQRESRKRDQYINSFESQVMTKFGSGYREMRPERGLTYQKKSMMIRKKQGVYPHYMGANSDF